MFVCFPLECLGSCFALCFNLIHSGRAQPGVVFVLGSLVNTSGSSLISPSNSSVISELTVHVLIVCSRRDGGSEGGDEWGAHLPVIGDGDVTILAGLWALLWNFLQCFIFIKFYFSVSFK